MTLLKILFLGHFHALSFDSSMNLLFQETLNGETDFSALFPFPSHVIFFEIFCIIFFIIDYFWHYYSKFRPTCERTLKNVGDIHLKLNLKIFWQCVEKKKKLWLFNRTFIELGMFKLIIILTMQKNLELTAGFLEQESYRNVRIVSVATLGHSWFRTIQRVPDAPLLQKYCCNYHSFRCHKQKLVWEFAFLDKWDHRPYSKKYPDCACRK